MESLPVTICHFNVFRVRRDRVCEQSTIGTATDGLFIIAAVFLLHVKESVNGESRASMGKALGS